MTHAQWREPPNESSLPLLFVHFIVFPLVAGIAATAARIGIATSKLVVADIDIINITSDTIHRISQQGIQLHCEDIRIWLQIYFHS